MSTQFIGEGNIGSPPEFHQFPNNKDDEGPHRLLRLNVHFDNPVPVNDKFEDRGGFWAPVELWHRDAELWSKLYQTGMRILVQGRMTCNEWRDSEDAARVTFKVEARRIGILPYRIEGVVMSAKSSTAAGERSVATS